VNRFLLALQSFDNKPDALQEKQMLETWKTSPLNFPYKFNYKTVREWDNAMAAGGHLNADGSWNEAKIVLACHYIKAYGINLNQKNPRVKDFDEIYEWCNNNNVSLYLNLLAENMHFADSLVGKDLVFLMQQNRDFLVERYHKGNCKVVDNLEMVSSKDFIDKDWTTEHYKYRGRMTVAKNVADSMKNQFSNEYKIAY